jgi:hypothetical protein
MIQPSDDQQRWRDEDDAPDAPERCWTARRILLLILVSLLAEYAVPILQSLQQPTPLPPFMPDSLRM